MVVASVRKERMAFGAVAFEMPHDEACITLRDRCGLRRFCLAPRWLTGEKPAASLRAMKPLIALTERVLGKIYTQETVAEELQARFGSLADYLRDPHRKQ